MILVATGLQREARILRGEDLRIAAGGGQSAALEAALDAQAAGAEAIISLGLAGALHPHLLPGAWIVGARALDGDTPYPTHDEWRYALLRTLPGALSGDVAGQDRIAVDEHAKADLASRTGAYAVDMETHIAARVAARWNKPFAIARTISDRMADALPPAALIAMQADGAIDIGAVVGSLIAEPGQIPALMRTARDAEAGFRALLRGRQILGGALGFGAALSLGGVNLGHLPLHVP